jgi:RimJ/RimL family protein N-acetyltransferase
MKYFKKIEGDRIYLSPLNLEDMELFTKWMNDSKVTDGSHATSKIVNFENEKDWLLNNLKSGNQTYGIILKENDSLIGSCGISNINHIDRTGTIGIMIGEEEQRNKGYGRETIKLIINYGFNILNLHNIDLSVFSFNKQAINCYKKVGFKEYGRRHECYYLNGTYYDEIFMEILETDYKNID